MFGDNKINSAYPHFMLRLSRRLLKLASLFNFTPHRSQCKVFDIEWLVSPSSPAPLNNSANTCGKIIVSLPLSRHNTHNRANKSEDGFERHVMTTKRVSTLRAPSGPAPAGLSAPRGLEPGCLSLPTLPPHRRPGTSWSQSQSGCGPVHSDNTRLYDTHMSVMTVCL